MIRNYEPDKNQFVNIKKMDKNTPRCEICQFYLAIDSGYGYCRRFPPKLKKEKWWKNEWIIEYLITEWCRRACGEFKKK